MLQLQNVSLSMRKDLRRLVENLSLSVNPGDRIALIGEEGNGKSTLLKWIYDESLVEAYAEGSGRVLRDKLLLGYLPQETSSEEKELTAYEFCLEEPAFSDASPAELRSVAAGLGLSPELFYDDRRLATLSGGEKVKLRLALLALKKPDVYLLDEPSNDLDLSTLDWLEKFLLSCHAPVLYISHDEALLEHTANGILHLEQLRRKTLPRHTFVRCGYGDYVQRRASQFAKQEQLARKEREEEKKQQERFAQIYQQVEHAQSTISRGDPHGGRLLKKKMKAVKSQERRMERERENATELPDSEDAILVGFREDAGLPAGKTVVDFSLPCLEIGEKRLAENIRLHVRGPEHICIIGENGRGKTTLLRRLAEELLPRRDLKAAYMPQDYGEQVDGAQTPVEFLARSGEKEEHTRVRTYLGSMKYTPEECAHAISELSGGQKAKLFFLKMILEGAQVLVLDEPTRNFSPLSGPVIRGILKDFPGCIISVSHDRKYIGQVCGRVVRLEETGLKELENPYADG